jgi:hypothetical protein
VAVAKMIGEFLLELSKENDRIAAYLQDPIKELEDSGLTDEQKEILLSNDLERIRSAVREEYERVQVVIMPMFVFVERRSSD